MELLSNPRRQPRRRRSRLRRRLAVLLVPLSAGAAAAVGRDVGGCVAAFQRLPVATRRRTGGLHRSPGGTGGLAAAVVLSTSENDEFVGATTTAAAAAGPPVPGASAAAELALSPPSAASAAAASASEAAAPSAPAAAPWLVPPPAALSLPRAPPEASASAQSLLAFAQSTAGPVASASLLVTGNTVGAGCLVLPHLAAGPGLAVSSGVFVGAYLINLLSGWTIAHVAVQQHRRAHRAPGRTAAESPTSFKELAHANVHPWAGTAVSLLSVFVNACVLIFALGQVGHWPEKLSLLPSGAWPSDDPMAASLAFAAAVGALVATQSGQSLSHVASACVAVMGFAFAGLLLPCVADATSAAAASGTDFLWSHLWAPGTDPDLAASVAKAAPVIVTSLVYQNIVPTVAKLLDYRMVPISVALAVGSFVPLAMYESWCLFAGPNGSVDPHSLLFQVFTVATLIGSTIGTTLSLSEEVQSLLLTPLGARKEEASVAVPVNDCDSPDRGASDSSTRWASVAASLAVPLAVAAWAEGSCASGAGADLSGALRWAGSLGSPLLYGVLPAVMAYRLQQQSRKRHPTPSWSSSSSSSMLTSWPCFGLLGGASTAFAANELLHRAGEVAASAVAGVGP